MSRREEIRQALAESRVDTWAIVMPGCCIAHEATAMDAALTVARDGDAGVALCTPCSRCGRILDDLPGGAGNVDARGNPWCGCGGEA